MLKSSEKMRPERFLVDTTIWVKYLRGLDLSLKSRISSLVLEERVHTSEIIIMEILRGAKSDKEYNETSAKVSLKVQCK